MQSLYELCEAVRRHPECRALIVWSTSDCVAANVNPHDVWWDMVETRGTEIGWQIIESCKDSKYL